MRPMVAESTPAQSNWFSVETEAPKPRLIVVGEPGIGKTTFGASAPNAILVPTEDGALAVDIPKAKPPGARRNVTWAQVLESVGNVVKEPHPFEWLVLDTLNGAVDLCAEYVCQRDFDGVWQTRKGKEGYNAFAKGDKATAHELRRLLELCDQAQRHRGMGVILLGHMGLHKGANALGADFQKVGGDMNRYSWALACGWADQVAWAHRELRTTVNEGERKAKISRAIGNERWLTFEGGPAVDAKSRAGYEMPERILLDWDTYAAELKADRLGALVEQSLELLKQVDAATRDKLKERLGGSVTKKALRGVGKQKLEALIGWLLARKHAQESEA